MAWAIDRLGRSLVDLLGTIQHLEAVGVDLYLDQQSIDTTTPAGKLLCRRDLRQCRRTSPTRMVS
jgi:DNA invertase Pin-like site-specific DNA recombinase